MFQIVAALSQETVSDGSLGEEDVTSSITSISRSCAPVDVFVCSLGSAQHIQERLKLLKSLWLAGIKAETAYERNPTVSLHDIQVSTSGSTKFEILACRKFSIETDQT